MQEGSAAADAVSVREFARVFWVFLRLGLTSFGGPIAHLAYFRTEFVERRNWLDDASYAELLALCQFLPGPASSQLGMAIGMRQAGLMGALAAWIGFTLPSALLMFAFALGLLHTELAAIKSALHGLLIVAVSVVGHAVYNMAKSLCPDRLRASIAVLACSFCMLVQGSLAQLLAIVIAGFAAGFLMPRDPTPVAFARVAPTSGKPRALICLTLFFLLLVGLPWLAWLYAEPWLQLMDGFYRAGALVFGGGHVVLPLLQAMLVPSGHLDADRFLAGYAAAQAMPGPLFSLAAFLGAVIPGFSPSWFGSLMALLFIFLPGFLLVIGVLPFWSGLVQNAAIARSLAGINAAVVGILLASLYDPIFVHAIREPVHFVVALLGFALLSIARLSPLWLVLLTVLTACLVDL